MPWPKPKCGLGLREMSKQSASAKSNASRLAEPSHTSTLSPGEITCPPSDVALVAVRRFDGDGDVQRTISSTAVGSSSRSERSKAN